MTATVCTVSLCYEGRAAMTKMRSTYDYLSANEPKFDSAKFEPSVLALEAEFSSLDSWYVTLIPFNPTCCAMADVGHNADILTNDMLASVGSTTIDIPHQPNPTDWSTMLLVGGVIVLAVVYSPQIKTLFKKG